MNKNKDKDIILRTLNLVKEFQDNKGEKFLACNDITLEAYRGKTLGIVGESGSGKSTLVRMISQIDEVTSGEIFYKENNILDMTKKEIRENRKNIQMVFQDPTTAFNPRMKIIDILTEPLINFGRLKKTHKVNKALELLEMVELGDEFLYRYPHSMSGGERQRIGIARALSLEPKVLICDEVTSALDVSIQKNIITLLTKLQKEKDICIIFICHDLALVQSFADEIAVMYRGNVVELLEGNMVKSKAKHPYTQLLISSVFSVDMDKDFVIEGVDNSYLSNKEVLNGCAFRDRCKHYFDKCNTQKPKLLGIDENHKVACHLDS